MNIVLVIAAITVAVIAYTPRLRMQCRQAILGIWNYWTNRSEYVELPAYLEDEVSKSNIAVFAKRAQRWKRVAEFSFIFAIASVVVGVGIFVFADRIAFNDPELARITQNRDDLQKQLDKKFAEGGVRRRQSFFVPELASAWRKLHTYVRSLPALIDEDISAVDASATVRQLVVWSRDQNKILVNLKTLNLGEGSLNPGKYTDSELAKLGNFLNEVDLDGSEFDSYIERLFALAANVRRSGTIDEDGLSELKELRASAEKLNPKSEAVQKNLSNWKDEVENLYGLALQTETQEVLSLQTRLNAMNEQILELRAKFNPNNAYSVIPLMVVRLGAVILLIFLTQILLAVYRYNTSLSTYYDSIADALRMATPRENGEGPSQKELLELMQNLNPKDYSYLLPESPINQIRDLASNKGS